MLKTLGKRVTGLQSCPLAALSPKWGEFISLSPAVFPLKTRKYRILSEPKRPFRIKG